MKKITLQLTVSEFLSLHQFCQNTFFYKENTSLDLVSDSQMIISDYFITLHSRVDIWKSKPTSKPHKLEIPLTIGRIIAKELIHSKLGFDLQSILGKMDKELVNNNFNLSKYIQDGTQNQVFC